MYYKLTYQLEMITPVRCFSCGTVVADKSEEFESLHFFWSALDVSDTGKLVFISKYLERMADHATNIGEMVIFMVKGKDIRHMSIIEEGRKGPKKK